LGLLDAFDDVLVEPLMPDGSVVTLDVGVLLRLAGLDMLDGNPMFIGPFRQLVTDVFGAIVDPNGAGLTAPFDDPIKASDHTLGGQRKVDLDAEALTVKIIQDVQQPKGTTIAEPVGHKIHLPGYIRCFWHRQRIGLVPLQPFTRFDPKVQFKLAVDPVNPFVV
jgi:hypothetical protein